MPYYGLEKIIWNENQLHCLDETQVKNKDVVRKEDIEGYPCWGGGTEKPGKQLTNEEIEEATAPPQEVQDALDKYRKQIQDLCDTHGLTFPTSVEDIRNQLQELYKSSKTKYRDASPAFMGIKAEIDEESPVTLKEVLDV